MKQKTEALCVGILHQVDSEEDFVDIIYITIDKDEANREILKTKERATKTLRLKCVIEREDYILCLSLDEKKRLEAFYVERIIIIKGEKSWTQK